MSRTSVRQKIGLALIFLLCLSNVPSALSPTPEGEVGPPFALLVADSVLAVIGAVAAAVAFFTGRRVALRVAAGALILIVVTAVPAFFSGVPAPVLLTVSGTVLLALVAVILAISPSRSRVVTAGESR
jgi:hypothetical protein